VHDMRYQVIRTGKDCWDVHAVEDIDDNVHGYERIGRICFENKRYAIDLVEWGVDRAVWKRQEKTYLTFRGAFRAITNPKPKLFS